MKINNKNKLYNQLLQEKVILEIVNRISVKHYLHRNFRKNNHPIKKSYRDHKRNILDKIYNI